MKVKNLFPKYSYLWLTKDAKIYVDLKNINISKMYLKEVISEKYKFGIYGVFSVKIAF
jgi:hypothetical protein